MVDPKKYIQVDLAKKLFDAGCKVESDITISAEEGQQSYPVYHYYDIMVTFKSQFFNGDVASHNILGQLYNDEADQKQVDDYIWEQCVFNHDIDGEKSLFSGVSNEEMYREGGVSDDE